MDERIIIEIKKRIRTLRTDEPMSAHTTFRAGGTAAVYAEPTEDELAELLPFLQEQGIGYFLLGNGSNVLFSDSGFDGLVIGIGRQMGRIHTEGNVLTAGAGALLSSVAAEALKHSLSGMEFASGIPGSVGGGVFMNAGAYGGEVKDILRRVTVLTPAGNRKTYAVSDLDLSYRHSIFSAGAAGEVVLSAVFALTPGDPEKIKGTTQDFSARRREKQPLEFPSAGSTFKRPEGHFAGKLIEDAGLKGFSVGGACVSEKHAGFVVNTGGATASDIYAVIRGVQERVFAASGVQLEPEVRLIGHFE